MLFVQQLAAAKPAVPAQLGVAGQLVLLQAAHRAAAAHAAAVAAAARAAAVRAAERAATARATARRHAVLLAARRAEAARAAQPAAVTQQAAVQQPAAPAVSSPSGSPEAIAQQLLAQFGWSGQFACLYSLWQRESGWNMYAENPSSGAYGIPQALPGSKMASAGSDWASNAATQIRWGLSYIKSVYGSPCGAWSHEEGYGWY